VSSDTTTITTNANGTVQAAGCPTAPVKGVRGSRRWRTTRRRARLVEGRHRRRVRQALHEAAKTVIGWAVQRRTGTLTVGDPRGVLDRDGVTLAAGHHGRRHGGLLAGGGPPHQILMGSRSFTSVSEDPQHHRTQAGER
jgi:hypothetical protein